MAVVISVPVAEKTYAVAQAGVGFVKALRDTLADGWQTGKDAPAVMAAAMELLPALRGAGGVAGELVAEPKAFASALVLTGVDVVALFVRK